MDEKYIWPLLGVFLGWVLSLIGTAHKSRKERKCIVGNLLTKLIRVERQIEIIILSTEKIKDIAGSWEKYEPLRQRVSNRHFLEPESVQSDLKSAIDALAPLYPIATLELEDIYHTLLKSKSADLTKSSTNKSAYTSFISAHEVTLEATLYRLAGAINKLALKHSILTFVRVLLARRRLHKNKKPAEQFATSVLDLAKLNKSQQ